MKNRQTQLGKGLMIGILTGLAVGVVAIGGVMYYLNNHKPSYDNLVKNQDQTASGTSAPEILQPIGASDEVPEFVPGTRPSVSSSEAETNPEAILNGQTPEVLPVITSAEQSDEPKKTNSDQLKIEPITKRSFLQVGAYKDSSQAETQKAKLALLGVEAKVYEVDLGGSKGVMHRVRIGPFTNEAQLSTVRQDLKDNGVDASVVN